MRRALDIDFQTSAQVPPQPADAGVASLGYHTRRGLNFARSLRRSDCRPEHEVRRQGSHFGMVEARRSLKSSARFRMPSSAGPQAARDDGVSQHLFYRPSAQVLHVRPLPEVA